MQAEEEPAKANPVGRGRWVLPPVLLVSVTVAYLERLNISLALPSIADDFGWSAAQVGSYGGLLTSVFFVGYGLSNIFLSPVAARFGPRRSLLGIVVLFSLFTALGAPLGFSIVALAATRVLLGLSEGTHFPMMSSLTKVWFPVRERSRANGTWVIGASLAPVLSPVLLVPVIAAFGWRAMFLGLGLIGMLITLPLFLRFIYDSPASSPHIGRTEAEYITAGLEEGEGRGGYGFLRRGVFYVVLLGGILNNFAVFGLLTWLPIYLTEGRGLAFADLSYAASVPYLAGILGLLVMSQLGDRLGRRATLAGLGFLMAGVAIYLASEAASIALVILFFALAVFCQTAYGAQEYALIQRILPRANIGGGTGVYNGIAILLGGGAGSAIIGAVVSATGSYKAGILVLVGVALAAGTTMLVLSRLIRY